MKFFLTCTEQSEQIWGSQSVCLPSALRAECEAYAFEAVHFCEDPKDADIIVFCEPYQQSELIWVPKLRAHPLVLRYPEKCYVISEEDEPIGFLSGLYTGLDRSERDPRRHRTCQYYRTMNPLINDEAEVRAASRPVQFLASFSGAVTHQVRRDLFDFAQTWSKDAFKLTETKNLQFNVNPNSDDKKAGQRAFIASITAAKFSLCPRGFGCNSYRVQESMALGRVPVILCDEWVPPIGPDWESFAIIVPEAEVGRLPAILASHEPEAAAMGRRARAAWEDYLSPEAYAYRCLEQIEALHRSRRHDERACFARWPGLIKKRNTRLNGTLSQRLFRRVRSLLKLS